MSNRHIRIKTLVKGKFTPNDLIVSVKKSNRKISKPIEKIVDKIWKEKVKIAKEKNKNLYNGILYRLNNIRKIRSKLHIELGIINFKTFLCINEIPEYFDLGEEYYKKPCHTLATVKTKDGKYVMVNLTGKSMNENNFDFIGGAMETKDKINSGEKIFESFFKELEEETHAKREDIGESFLKLVYLNHKTNIGFYFEVVLKLTQKQLINKFNRGKKDHDIKSLKFFNRNQYLTELKKFNVNKRFISKNVEI